MNFVLLVFNIQSSTNLGQLIRNANAFGALEICVVGRKKFSSFGNQGTASAIKIRRFYKIHEALHHYKCLNFDIVGIEISDTSISINKKSFVRNSVFILGNEGAGIHPKILAACDYCVFVPQFGSGASINVSVACGIVLNAFVKNRQAVNKISGFKFENV